MDLRSLSDTELDQSLFTYIRKEKEALKGVLFHIAEVDRRRLYLKMAYPSLYTYLTERMGYDGGSAQRRIDAARLSQEVPLVIEHMDRGLISFAQVTFLQKTLRQSKDQKPSKEIKASLVEEMKTQSLRETQVSVSRTLNIELKQSPKVTHQANESVRLEVTISKDHWEKLQELREALSNSLPSGSIDQVLEYLIDKLAQEKTSRTNKTLKSETSESRTNLKRQTLDRDKCCQYKDQKSGRVCGSKWNLEVDHIQPLWAKGVNTLSNLRVLCSNHNKELYRQQSNIRRI